MVTTSLNPSRPWGVRLGTLALWALAGASLVYWGLRLTAQPGAGAPAATAAAPVVPDAQALARLLGAGPAVPAAAAPALSPASRFALVGVLAGRQSGGGAALIAVDGKPAKPYRVGASIEPGLVLQAVGPREARLGASAGGASTLTLAMPVPNAPAAK
ncbi:type II secretion system protein N [Paenacidovorax monticola]|uniref:General secretion pathway protein C n=1 Tax=Paenacidovorax monticola TaxID=1926868 RepID=A0A7H0HEM2_9BURK|nr:type II secretion system protein N [Paenacidovorax monticola]QNP58988.1 general secretion pathway protein C [Paenacidovorax monticola]